MGYVSNWLHDHNFHRMDTAESKSTMKTVWETILLVILLAMIILTVIAFVAPNTAAVILGYFL